ncbi:uncharacterized protein LOC118439317 [Folsomia candida]|uniref:uncharacterized protein LOC118439317 n=1 Tax=Folsomia candida TaxID=158441 RepID=UPI001604D23A|nr:uncharacterized protein LOC118439317 [Folsomia candida]
MYIKLQMEPDFVSNQNILSNIFSNLKIKDLKSCSQVSLIWEGIASKILATKKVVNLTTEVNPGFGEVNIFKYLDQVCRVESQVHISAHNLAKLNLPRPDVNTLMDAFKQLGGLVKELSISWGVNGKKNVLTNHLTTRTILESSREMEKLVLYLDFKAITWDTTGILQIIQTTLANLHFPLLKRVELVSLNPSLFSNSLVNLVVTKFVSITPRLMEFRCMEVTPRERLLSSELENIFPRFGPLRELGIPIVPEMKSFLGRQRNLEKIDISISYFDVRDLRCLHAVQKLLDSNQGTLTHVKMEFRDPGQTETWDVIVLPKMANLESLELSVTWAGAGSRDKFKSAAPSGQSLIVFPPFERGNFAKLKLLRVIIQEGKRVFVTVNDEGTYEVEDLVKYNFIKNLLAPVWKTYEISFPSVETVNLGDWTSSMLYGSFFKKLLQLFPNAVELRSHDKEKKAGCTCFVRILVGLVITIVIATVVIVAVVFNSA